MLNQLQTEIDGNQLMTPADAQDRLSCSDELIQYGKLERIQFIVDSDRAQIGAPVPRRIDVDTAREQQTVKFLRVRICAYLHRFGSERHQGGSVIRLRGSVFGNGYFHVFLPILSDYLHAPEGACLYMMLY